MGPEIGSVPNEFRNIFISTVFWPCPGDLERHQSTVIAHHWNGRGWKGGFSTDFNPGLFPSQFGRGELRANLSNPNLGRQEIPGSLFQDGEVFLCELGRSSNKKRLFLFVSCICLPRPPTLWTGQEILVEPKLHPTCSQAAMLQPSSTGHEYLVRICN